VSDTPAEHERRRRRRRVPTESVVAILPEQALVVVDERALTLAREYAVSPRELRPGNDVVLLRAGAEAFPAMLAAIATARRTIVLETYILEDDRTGARFAEALRERARSGVSVRLMYDAVGGFGLSDTYLAGLRGDGVKVLEYHPVAPWRRRFHLTRRDHRKILVVDDEVAFAGGINIGDDYADRADGGRGWHDMHCRVRGPIVLDLAKLFRRVWINEGGDMYPAPSAPPDTNGHGGALEWTPPPPGTSLARILDNRKYRKRRTIRRAYLRAINRADRTILLENAYFLPDHGLTAALIRAVKRGVAVRVIVPGSSDVRAIEYASLWAQRTLVKHGIQMLHWLDSMMHAKTAVIDGVWSTVGSYNLDNVSLLYNLEVVVEIVDPTFGEVMNDQFQADAAKCRAVSLDAWRQLPWWKKALAWGFAQFSRWL
jgi:cardiolipin synthase